MPRGSSIKVTDILAEVSRVTKTTASGLSFSNSGDTTADNSGLETTPEFKMLLNAAVEAALADLEREVYARAERPSPL